MTTDNMVPLGDVAATPETEDFLDAAANGRLLLQRCAQGHFSEAVAQSCRVCGSPDLAGAPASGGASVVSWAVAHGRPTQDGPAPRTVLVIAELDEGPWHWSQIVGADPDGVTEGMRLKVAFRRTGNGEHTLPVFEVA